MVEKVIGISVGPNNIEDSNLSHSNRYMGEGKIEQHKLQMTDKKMEHSKKLMIESETQSKVMIELSAQTLSSTKTKTDSFPPKARSLLQNSQDTTVKISIPEMLIQSPAISDTYIINCTQEQEVSTGSECLENSTPESTSRASWYRSLKFKREKSKDFQGKLMCELASWDKNKKPETGESLEKPEADVLELRDIHPELTVTIESKALEDLEVTDLKVEKLAALGNLGDIGVDLCNTQVDPAHRSLTALTQKLYEDNSLSAIGCNAPPPIDFEPIPSFSEFPLDSPKTPVLNFEAEGKQTSSNPRSGRITPNILKTGHVLEVKIHLGQEQVLIGNSESDQEFKFTRDLKP